MKKFISTLLFAFFALYSNAQLDRIMLSAEKGDVEAQKFLAQCYSEGTNGLRKNNVQAFVWTKAVAEQGDGEYEYILSQLYSKGIGTPKDSKAMMEWMEKSAQHGYALAMSNLGFLYFMSGQYKESIPLLEGALKKGETLPYYMLGKAYLKGNGVEQNYTKAFQHLNAAVQAEIIPAYKELAYCYAYGHGVRQNFKEAHRLIDSAHDKQPDNLEFYDDKGTFYLMEGKFDMAKKVWEKLINKDSLYPEMNHTMFTAAMTNSIDYNIPVASRSNERTIVLIIANEHYRRVSPVVYANSDGQIMYKYCTSALGIPERNIIYVEDATLADMKYNVESIKQRLGGFNGDCNVICYYAGHGIPDQNAKTAFLLPVDSYGTDTSTGYPLEDFYKSLSELPAKSVTVLLDACFSGAKREGDMLVAARGVAIKVKDTKPKGNLVVISAAQGDETAYPYENQKHGLFTYYLLRKIQETNAECTLGEIADYVKAEVLQKSFEMNGKSQTPTVSVSASLENIWRNHKLK